METETLEYALYSADGTPINGLLEQVRGHALISTTRKAQTGEFEFDYAGDTEMYWDEQSPVYRDGQRIFLDDDGTEYQAQDVYAIPVELVTHFEHELEQGGRVQDMAYAVAASLPR